MVQMVSKELISAEKSMEPVDEEIFVFPASFAQQRLWFLDQLEPGSPYYNIPTAVRLKGKLDTAALERTLNEIVWRHETLRTTFATLDGKPVQVIASAKPMLLPVENLQTLPAAEREKEAQRLANKEARQPFDLTTGPLLRARLLHLDEDDHVVLLTMHHIISDGWSIGVLVAEIATIYEAFSAGEPSPLPDLPIQYADFAEWQQEWLAGEVREQHLAYWKQQLRGRLPVLELPVDRPRPAIQTFRGATKTINIPGPVVEELKALGRQEGATLFMTLLAAFQTLLYRYSGQEDICVGSPIANRNREEIEGLIGFFVNTLVLRADLSGDPSFREILRQVKKVTLDAYAHQDLPFEVVVEALQPERDTSYNPLFQVMFILQNAPVKAQLLSGLSIQMMDAETGTATFDLTLSLAEQSEGLSTSIEYNTDLFDAETIQRLLGHFQVILEGIAANPDQKIAALPLLAESERHRLLMDWNRTGRAYPEARFCLHQLFEAQVERTPDSTALVWPSIELEKENAYRITYRDLNRRANQLAHALQKLGVGPDVLVGICIQRSPEMVIGALGVLKAGGAYLPMDPDYPSERLGAMLEDAQVAVLLTEERLVPGLPAHRTHLLCLDRDWPEISRESEENLPATGTPDHLAYVIYTSGSTGMSKGVMIRQRSIVNAYLAWEDAYRLRFIHPDRGFGHHLQMANFSFDVFTGDLVRALLSGGKLVLCPREFLLAPQQLYKLMRQEEIDCAEFVPAVLRQLIEYLQDADQRLDFMRLLICGSDSWYVEEYRRFLSFCGPETRLINSFGLTEATIDSSFYESHDLDLSPDRLVPIGRPFANTQLFILDKRLQPLPIGVQGELYVGGAGVAAGYLNRPELTAEKFIPNPFIGPGIREAHLQISAIDTQHLYKTGDLARYLPDGNIEFLGRMDYQVKIRGFRIETGEVEAVLRHHPAVRDAVVVARSIAGGTAEGNGRIAGAQSLVAYLVADIPVDRVPWKGKCWVTHSHERSSAAWDHAIELTTADFSYGGVCLADAPLDWSVGNNIQIRFQPPYVSEELSAYGRVVWRHEGAAGIQLEVTSDEQALLRQSIRRLAESQDGLVIDLRNGYEPRVPLRSVCVVEFVDGRKLDAMVENLSPGGVRLVTENVQSVFRGARAESQPLSLRMQLNGSSDVWLKGSVWWQRGDRVGIRFETTPYEQEWLEQTVQAIIREQSFSLTHLRSFLKSKLPDYMVPSAYVVMDALPLTQNGKIDRKVLPEPDWTDREGDEEYVAPRTPAEEILAGLWSLVLGLQRVSIHDNFFELGGHSLLATQLTSRVRNAFHVDLPVRKLFELPTLAMLAEYIEITQLAEAGVAAQPIRPVSHTGNLPLSFAQQRLWFLDQLEPGSPFYNLSETVRLKGPLDVQILERCLNEIVRRHDSLRTTFPTVDGKPAQVIASNLVLPFSQVDLTDLTEVEREAEAQRLAMLEAQAPFDLVRGPLLRARLLRLADDDHVALLTMHHIIGDDWSSNVLIQELSLLYEAFSNGRPSPLPELAIQYADFAVWQREWLHGEVLEKQLAYWKQQLGGSPPLLELPADRPRPAVQTFHGAYQTFMLSSRLTNLIKALCQKEGVTLFMLLLAAFQTLLYRYSGQEDINVGTPIANRNRADIEGLIGFFVNTLVLRGDLSGEPTFRTLLKRVRETALGAYAHQDLPFEMIVDALQPERDLSHSPLFQVMFVIQNAPARARELPGLTLSSMDVHSGTAKFDLTLFMLEEADRLGGAFEYNTDLFDAATIRRMVEHFQTLLESIAADPDKLVSRLRILSEAERHLLLVEWNDTAHDYPYHLCAHQLFEAQVEKTPDAVAVASKDQALTYRELNRRANQLAHALQNLGVGPDRMVGVCLERSPELLVALLGVLKAGGAYVPLDPKYPPERLAYMLEDSRASVLLTQQSLAEGFYRVEGRDRDWPGVRDLHLICLDKDWQAIAGECDQNPQSGVTPDNLVYVIYTSGSTGKPKGAMLEHRGLVNYLTWTMLSYPLEAGQGSPVHSSISFDLTVTSLFTPLISGRRALLLDEDLGVESLTNAVQAEAHRSGPPFSLIKITPAHLQLLGQQLAQQEAAGRTHAFIIGGENLTAEHIAFWQEHAPQTALVNEYGPTETVVGCCVYRAPAGKHTSGVIPIGVPIINTRLYVLDRYGQPVPVGVPGELYIGGDGVGRGYLNRPELTAEKFIPDPFTPESPTHSRGDKRDQATRLYKTGDLVRWRPDGNLECLGRIDFQVKIRGFRVELGEIETALSHHPAIAKVVVWPWEEASHRRLAAYIVPAASDERASGAGNSQSLVGELREYLAKNLPDYMIPAAFVFLEALPLTANGKVDRKALPAPDQAAQEPSVGYIAPSSREEEILAGIWMGLLGVKKVGVHDNFFELGGDSILAIQIIARANQAGLRLTPRQLFEFPTVAGLAAAAGTTRIAWAEQGLVSGSLPLTPIQRWFFEQDFPHNHHWNQSLMLEVNDRLNRPTLEAALQALLSHHDALRLRFWRTDNGWEQANAGLEGELPLDWVDLSGVTETDQAAAIEAAAAQAQTSLNLQRGPLLRVVCFDLGNGKPDRLLLVIHHLAVDGVSWRILLEDFQYAYQALEQGEALLLPLKTSAFRDWARQLVDYARSEKVHSELEYWLSAHQDCPASLPVDFSVGENSEASAGSLTVGLTSDETRHLLQEVPRVYHTEINDALLAALAQALSRWTGGRVFLVDLEGHGREDVLEGMDISRTVGWFTTRYPQRLDLPASRDPGEILKAVKEQIRGVPQRGIGYGLLRYLSEDQAIRERLDSLPSAQLSFNYLGQMDQLIGEASSFGLARESSGADHSPAGKRTHLIDVNGGIAGGRLQMEWSYSQNLHRKETVECLAQDFIEALRALIHQSENRGQAELAVEDFADFGWSQDDVDDILKQINELD